MEKIKILAVDDEAGVLNVFKNVLGKYEDYTLTAESSTFKAVKLIKQERFDIFLIDYQLDDDSTGIDLLKLVHEEYGKKDYVSILFAAHGTTDLYNDEKNTGLFDFFVKKPFEIDDFLQVFFKGLIKLGKRRNRKIM